MPVRMDDTPLAMIESPPTLGGALALARARAEANHRVITDVLLDGRPVPEEQLGSLSHALKPDADLCFRTADPIELVQASFRDAAEALQEVDELQSASAAALQAGHVDQAMTTLAEAFSTWDTARRVVTDGCSLLGLNPQTLAIEIDPAPAPPVLLSAEVQTLVLRLTEVKRCLTARDWSGLSDTLNYDLPADADRWRNLLRSLADNLSELR